MPVFVRELIHLNNWKVCVANQPSKPGSGPDYSAGFRTAMQANTTTKRDSGCSVLHIANVWSSTPQGTFLKHTARYPQSPDTCSFHIVQALEQLTVLVTLGPMIATGASHGSRQCNLQRSMRAVQEAGGEACSMLCKTDGLACEQALLGPSCGLLNAFASA